MVQQSLETNSLPFSFDCNEFRSSYFGYYMKDKFILEHHNYIHRKRLLFFWTTFGDLFDGDSNFSEISSNNDGYHQPKMRD